MVVHPESSLKHTMIAIPSNSTILPEFSPTDSALAKTFQGQHYCQYCEHDIGRQSNGNWFVRLLQAILGPNKPILLYIFC